MLSEPNAYDKWRGPGCVQIPLLTEPKAYDKWRAHGHRVWRAFFQKNLFFFCFIVFFFLIHKVFDQSTQWKNVLIEPKDNIKWRGPGCERER